MPDPTTIVAVSTPAGVGALGLVRMSGPRAIEIGRQIFQSRPALGQRLRHGEYERILGSEGEPIDTGLGWAMVSPRTYTGEDTVEISCHGSRVILEGVVEAAVGRGAEVAGPGEFTRRAFCNDRLDLVQAEAVLDLIRSQSHAGLETAYGHADGRLSALVRSLRELLVEAISRLEIALDFSEEDIDPAQRDRPRTLVAEAASSARSLLDTFAGCRRRQEGLKVALIGRPNAGKSTLLNALLGEERAIVTSEAGTTRDLVEGTTYWQGELVRIFDTAGLRRSVGTIEEEGIRRARAAAAAADVVVGVIDATEPWQPEDEEVENLVRGRNGILALNKTDLGRAWFPRDQQATRMQVISALTGSGIDALRGLVVEQLPPPSLVEGVGITHERHRDCLQRMVAAAQSAVEALASGAPDECVVVDLQVALAALGEMLGEEVSDSVLDRIFADFCIGK